MRTLTDSLSPTAAFLARHSAIIALALFAAVGVFVLDDYGITSDEGHHRKIGYASFNYILGDEDALLDDFHRFYGVAFEISLIAVERVFGLEDSRAIYLSRHLITHLFFLAGGFFAWLLAHRLFGSRLVALLAMLLFLLHPRLYAHSFFNPKDLPFLSAFMIALYLTHRAFRRDSVWAFALCGAGVGLIANIRIMGVMLFPAVLGMLALDAVFAARRGERDGIKRAFANAGAFIAAFAAILYVSSPLLWREPLSAAEGFATLAQHPHRPATLFRGEWVQWPNIPWDYIPTWILITTPPAALILAALGTAYLARLCAVRWRDMFENSTARFGLLAAACLILPIAAAVSLNSNMYGGWRQVYFLYAPLCVLSAFGLRALSALPKPSLRTAAYALAALGIAIAGVQTVRLHPMQKEYFGPLVDRSGIADRWETRYWNDTLHKEALETMLKMQPDGHILANDASVRFILPEEDRRRLATNRNFPSFRIVNEDVGDAAVWKREAYGIPIISLIDSRAESEAAFRAVLEAASASAPVASGGGFDIYREGDTLTYIKEGCGDENALSRFSLSVFPADRNDLPQDARNAGAEHESLNFDFLRYGAILDGKCVIVRNLPDYPISHIQTSQWLPGEDVLWSAHAPLEGYAERYAELHARAQLSLSGAPVASGGGFDIYRDGGSLAYIKEGCGEADARVRFSLSVFPIDRNDLPQDARDAGAEHESLNFDLWNYGAIFDGKCVIIRNLPDYPISHIQTGQWIDGEGVLWSARILSDGFHERYRRALESLSGAPAIRSDFDVYLGDGALTYVKSPCAKDDARGRFALSVYPADRAGLSQSARDAGLEHEPLNFDFDQYGAILDGKCAIIRRLPDYPISHVETGQWIPGEGELWRGRIDVGD